MLKLRENNKVLKKTQLNKGIEDMLLENVFRKFGDAEREKLKTMVPVTSSGSPSLERVGYVVEAKPVAEIVRPVENPQPEKRMV